MKNPRYPSLYQVNTRVWLTALARGLGRKATLDDIPDADLDRIAGQGFDWVWMLSVWQTGPAGQGVSRSNPDWRHEFEKTLPDLAEADIPGSGFAITGYTVHQDLGGDAALARLRKRLRQRGLKLMLDFVPNHTGLDHPWVESHPDYYVAGTELDLARAPQNYTWVQRSAGPRLMAYGRDPYFPGWPDTLQLNYANPALQKALIAELLRISGQCDGLRCDMAMLVLPDVFERTWGQRPELFWPEATRQVREQVPGFTFMAEVYWGLEWTMQQQGFDYAYDKRLYDRLRDGHARPVREHLHAGLDYQDRLARFLENHDEPRAADTFPLQMHKAAAVVTFLTPGLRFFHQGQLQGHRVRISPHLNRGPYEATDPSIEAFYSRLLPVLRDPLVRDGKWQLLRCVSAWEGNWTCDCYIAWAWEGAGTERIFAVVNYAPNRSQCYVQLALPNQVDGTWLLRDLLSESRYHRDGAELQSQGLYVDMGPYEAAVFSFTREA